MNPQLELAWIPATQQKRPLSSTYSRASGVWHDIPPFSGFRGRKCQLETLYKGLLPVHRSFVMCRDVSESWENGHICAHLCCRRDGEPGNHFFTSSGWLLNQHHAKCQLKSVKCQLIRFQMILNGDQSLKFPQNHNYCKHSEAVPRGSHLMNHCCWVSMHM